MAGWPVGQLNCWLASCLCCSGVAGFSCSRTRTRSGGALPPDRSRRISEPGCSDLMHFTFWTISAQEACESICSEFAIRSGSSWTGVYGKVSKDTSPPFCPRLDMATLARHMHKASWVGPRAQRKQDALRVKECRESNWQLAAISLYVYLCIYIYIYI